MHPLRLYLQNKAPVCHLSSSNLAPAPVQFQRLCSLSSFFLLWQPTGETPPLPSDSILLWRRRLLPSSGSERAAPTPVRVLSPVRVRHCLLILSTIVFRLRWCALRLRCYFCSGMAGSRGHGAAFGQTLEASLCDTTVKWYRSYMCSV